MPNVPAPHYLLFADADRNDESGSWSFMLKSANGADRFGAADREPDAQGERLELLSVVRGLEALDQPSQVTVVTRSRYIERGLSDGLDDWRSSGWTWEKYGQMVPVKNCDLWRRVDRAMRFHGLQCRRLRLDAAHGNLPMSAPSAAGWAPHATLRRPVVVAARGPMARFTIRLLRFVRERLDGWRLRAEQLGTSLLPRPWLG